jgi:hypothetical protein
MSTKMKTSRALANGQVDVNIANMIHDIRGHRVLSDVDLARLYQVETKTLNRAVKRNISRFPSDFMFQLEKQEANQILDSRCQNGTLKRGGNIKYLPYVFTEQGVAMLSSVLRSDRAIQVNVAIMRAFVQMRKALVLTTEFSKKLNELDAKVIGHDAAIKDIVNAIRQLMLPPSPPRRRIGFNPGSTDLKA